MMELAKFFWKEKTFWSDGYFSCSIGNISKETIEKYIQNKKKSYHIEKSQYDNSFFV